MKKIQIILMAVLLAAGMGYSAVITNLLVNFTSDTVGLQPTGAVAIRPLVNTSTGSVTVITGSAIGSGNAVRYTDISSGPVGLEYNFVASSNHNENAVGVKFTYSQRSTIADADNISIAIGEYAAAANGLTLNSSTRRIAEFQIRNSGIVRSMFGGAQATIAVPGGAFAIGSVNTVELFVNDKDSATVNYVQGVTTYALNANSYAIWINGINYGGTAGGAINTAALVDNGAATAATTEWNLGKFGFTSSSAAVGLDVDFDNIVVTSLIPEPATMGMLLLGAVTVFAVRRRRA